ncbi:hypothetical protein EDB19DRAFT_1688343 [Suillus lakei]|nr:hypothetical protein EDB19DRAFT_1688343 [Suillus lakei]
MFFFFLALIHTLPLAIFDLFCHLLFAPAPVFTLPSALAPALTPTPALVVAFAISLPSASPSIPQNSSF